MYRITVIDLRSGDTDPQCVDFFDSFTEASEIAALHMEDAASYEEETHVRNDFQVAAKAFRAKTTTDQTVDGFHVSVECMCRANTTRGSVSDPTAYGCDLPEGHDGPHVVENPLGPDTGTWSWMHGRHMVRVH